MKAIRRWIGKFILDVSAQLWIWKLDAISYKGPIGKLKLAFQNGYFVVSVASLVSALVIAYVALFMLPMEVGPITTTSIAITVPDQPAVPENFSADPIVFKSEPYCYDNIAVVFPSHRIVVLKVPSQTFGESERFYYEYFLAVYGFTVNQDDILAVGYEPYHEGSHVVSNEEGGLFFDGKLCVTPWQTAQ